MKKLFYVVVLSIVSVFNTKAQTFVASVTAETTGPDASPVAMVKSSDCNLDNNVVTLSNFDKYVIYGGGAYVKISGWAAGLPFGGGGFTVGYSFTPDGTITPNIAYALPRAVDVRVGLLESVALSKLYAVVSYYNVDSGSYDVSLYAVSGSTPSMTLVSTKVLMKCSYNRLSMDMSRDINSVAFTWSDGSDVYTATALLNAALDELTFSPSLLTPPIKIVSGGIASCELPDIAFTRDDLTGMDTLVFVYYDANMSEVKVLKESFSQLYGLTSSTHLLTSIDNQSVLTPVVVNLDAPSLSPNGVYWGYAYTDDDMNIKVRHRGEAGIPVSIILNDGSLHFRTTGTPAITAMSCSAPNRNFNPVISYPIAADRYHVGWVTNCVTDPLFTDYSYLYLQVADFRGVDSIMSTLPDYLLIPKTPPFGASSLAPLLSFSRSGENAWMYSVHAQEGPALPYRTLVHKVRNLHAGNPYKVGYETEDQPIELSIAPNPSNHIFKLSLLGQLKNDNIAMELFDITGRSLVSTKGTLDEVNTKLKSTSLALKSGSYILHTKFDEQQKSFNLMKTE